jgi:hypothetical protein
LLALGSAPESRIYALVVEKLLQKLEERHFKDLSWRWLLVHDVLATFLANYVNENLMVLI